jgi:hypothetical protein
MSEGLSFVERGCLTLELCRCAKTLSWRAAAWVAWVAWVAWYIIVAGRSILPKQEHVHLCIDSLTTC